MSFLFLFLYFLRVVYYMESGTSDSLSLKYGACNRVRFQLLSQIRHTVFLFLQNRETVVRFEVLP